MLTNSNFEKFQEAHFKNLPEKTIMKNKIPLGVIYPIP